MCRAQTAAIRCSTYEIRGILPVNPSGGKVARAQAISPLVEAGNIYLPHPEFAPWVNDFIEECVQFPNGAHDAKSDAMTQALLRWHMVPTQQTFRLPLRPGPDQPVLMCLDASRLGNLAVTTASTVGYALGSVASRRATVSAGSGTSMISFS